MAGGTGGSDPWGVREEPEEFQGMGNQEIRIQQNVVIMGKNTEIILYDFLHLERKK